MPIRREAFLNEVGDAYEAELQVIRALPTLLKAATSRKLKAVFEAHLVKRQARATLLEQVIVHLAQTPRVERDPTRHPARGPRHAGSQRLRPRPGRS
jgi:ferritin-like metal-binding protein YciE